MKYVEGSEPQSEAVYKIYAYDPGKDHWWCLDFLGEYKSPVEAEDAITRYLQQPENQSAEPEVYQVRLEVTSNILAFNIVWDPKGTVEKRAAPPISPRK